MTNAVFLMGNLTADPELRYGTTGTAVCTFTLAHNKRWRTESGEEKERVSFIGCVMFGKRAEAFAKHHSKGTRAFVEGELAQDTWEDKETGKKREKTKVHVNSWEFVNGRQEAAPAARPAPARTKPAAAPDESSATESEAPPTDDDDLPF